MTQRGSLSAAPTPPNERIEVIDILRGFALLGILLVNFRGLESEAWTGVDRITNLSLHVLVQGSFYPLFSFLFGVGYALQVRGRSESALYRDVLWIRRMAALFIVGAAHSVLIWGGDILTDYAILGCGLVLARRIPVRWVALAGVVLLSLQAVPSTLERVVSVADVTATDSRAEALAVGAAADAARRTAAAARVENGRSYASDVRDRLKRFGVRVSRLTRVKEFVTRDIFPLFLIGYIVGVYGWLESSWIDRSWTWVAGVLIATVALVAAVGLRWGGPSLVTVNLTPILRRIENHGLTVAYVLLIVSAVSGTSLFSRICGILSPVGRMALTNYLAQSIVMTWMFLPYGLGLPRPSTVMLVVLHLGFFFLVQIPGSVWWLERYRYGPIEWLWRTVVYARYIPNRYGERSPHGASEEPGTIPTG